MWPWLIVQIFAVASGLPQSDLSVNQASDRFLGLSLESPLFLFRAIAPFRPSQEEHRSYPWIYRPTFHPYRGDSTESNRKPNNVIHDPVPCRKDGFQATPNALSPQTSSHSESAPEIVIPDLPSHETTQLKPSDSSYEGISIAPQETDEGRNNISYESNIPHNQKDVKNDQSPSDLVIESSVNGESIFIDQESPDTTKEQSVTNSELVPGTESSPSSPNDNPPDNLHQPFQAENNESSTFHFQALPSFALENASSSLPSPSNSGSSIPQVIVFQVPLFPNSQNSSDSQEPQASQQKFNIRSPTDNFKAEDFSDFPGNTEETEEDCTCVPYYQCEDGSIITDGTGLLDIRLKPGACEDYMSVCCKKPLDENKAIKPAPTKRLGCGFRHPEGIGFRITGAQDNEAQFGEFPWMVAVLKVSIKNPDLLEYQCGGALIHENVVLTAAHCVKAYSRRPGDLTIRAGEWDTQRDNEVYSHKDVKAEAIFVHPEFSSGSLWNDIALVFLEEPLPLGENIDTVCLPKNGEVPLHKECFASGWGKNNYGNDSKYQVILKKVDLPIVHKDKCEELLRKTRLGNQFNLHKSFICAGGIPGKDTCKGDGGSPLVCPVHEQPGIYEVTGIVSWGIGCGGEAPGIYTNVAYARDWIDKILAQFNVNIS